MQRRTCNPLHNHRLFISTLRVRYQTLEFDGNVDLHIRSLRDTEQFSDIDGVAEKLGISSAMWPLFGIVWASGEILAHLMLNYEIAGRRVLEVGCGLALASLILNRRSADITATDFHPEAANFLRENVKLNTGKTIPFIRTGWKDSISSLGKYDLIIGSDILYERRLIYPLADFINQHANPTCEIVIVDPGRGNHAYFSKKMVSLGYAHTQRKPTNLDYLEKPFKGRILRYLR